MNVPLIRVTQLESFRRYMSDDYSYVTEQDVIDGIAGTFQGNTLTRIGSAFHRIVEEGTPKCSKVDEGFREYTYYNKPVREPIPCGRAFDVDGETVVMDVPQIKTALEYRQEFDGAFHEVREYKDYGNAIVTGCADMIYGNMIRDIKTKFSPVEDKDYINSCQWRYYLELFDTDTFAFDLFVFDGYDKDKHKADVRGLPIIRHEPPIMCYRYYGMELENRALLDSFLHWAEYRGLIPYLIKQKVA